MATSEDENLAIDTLAAAGGQDAVSTHELVPSTLRCRGVVVVASGVRWPRSHVSNHSSSRRVTSIPLPVGKCGQGPMSSW